MSVCVSKWWNYQRSFGRNLDYKYYWHRPLIVKLSIHQFDQYIHISNKAHLDQTLKICKLASSNCLFNTLKFNASFPEFSLNDRIVHLALCHCEVILPVTRLSWEQITTWTYLNQADNYMSWSVSSCYIHYNYKFIYILQTCKLVWLCSIVWDTVIDDYYSWPSLIFLSS